MDFAGKFSRHMKKAAQRFFADCRVFGDDTRAASAVEFAMVAPVMLFIMYGSFQFAITIYNYIGVANAVSVGARSFTMSRASAITTPHTTTVALMRAALPTTMTSANLTVTLSVGASATATTYTACTTDALCTTALSTASGYPVQVTASYPTSFSVSVMPGYTMSYTFNLSSSTVGRVE